MPKSHARYAPEYRRRMVELVRAGRKPEELAKEFEPTAQTIYNWVAQADRDSGKRHRRADHGGARGADPAASRDPATREAARDTIKSRGLVRDGDRVGAVTTVPVHESESGHVGGCHHGAGAGGLRQRLLCVAQAAAIRTGARRRGTHFTHPRDSYVLTRNLWGAADSRGASSGWHPGRAQAGRAPDEGRRPARREPPPWISTTERERDARPAPDLVERNFNAAAPNQLWVADVTYVPTGRVSVPRGGAGCVQPASRRLGDGDPSAHRAGARRR